MSFFFSFSEFSEMPHVIQYGSRVLLPCYLALSAQLLLHRGINFKTINTDCELRLGMAPFIHPLLAPTNWCLHSFLHSQLCFNDELQTD